MSKETNDFRPIEGLFSSSDFSEKRKRKMKNNVPLKERKMKKGVSLETKERLHVIFNFANRNDCT